MKAEVDLVDIGGGNIGSISRCLERLNVRYRKSDAANPPDGSRPLVVPGVGAFGAVMQSLRASELDKRLVELVGAGTPYLGICVGMQILFDGSEESTASPGLSLVPGKVVRFRHPKVPQIGWNKLTSLSKQWQPGYAYFVNSYFPVPDNAGDTLYEANYGGSFCAAIRRGNVTAFQFHPEKSGAFGESLLTRWVENVG
ncbi:MAG TPA: imidazole glycerol phosphate synthase subunit HisH [Candidatus Obscuribacterales bacterium]